MSRKRRRQRPPICSPAQAGALGVMLLVGVISRQPWLYVGVFVVGVWFIATWLLAPYSRFAFRQRQPGPEHFEKQRLRAERVKNTPILGPIFRASDNISHGAGGKLATEYEKWIREHSVENPHKDRSESD